MIEKSFSEISAGHQKLLECARDARLTAYAPYSRFLVGAAVRTPDGVIITGSNVENASYGGTICAERAALVAANALGHRHFTAIAIVAASHDGVYRGHVGPCGICRQFIHEFSCLAGEDIEIILSDPDLLTTASTSIRALLPHSFGAEKLR